jgi:hypothetical protein
MMLSPLLRDSIGVVSSMVSPSNITVPASFSYTPERIFISVDFPAPFSPTIPCTIPRAISMETLSSAFTPGNDLLTSLMERMIPESFFSTPPLPLSNDDPLSSRSEPARMAKRL